MLNLVISTEELIVNLKITDTIVDHQTIQYSIETEKGNTASEKNNYNFRKTNFDAMRIELDHQTFEEPIFRNNAELGFEIHKNPDDDASRRHIPRKRATINNELWIKNDIKQAIGRRQRADDAKRRINSEETMAEYIEARRQVKRIVKQEKHNMELSTAKICKYNPKTFDSYINY